MKRLLAVSLLLLPSALAAQEPVKCDLASSRQSQTVGQGAVTYIGLPVFRCTNGSMISADSAVQVSATHRADFIGNVRFAETNRVLTSQYAQYSSAERRLMAQGNVVLKDNRDGSTLRAPALDYFQKGGSNPQDKIEIYNGRPHAVLVRERANQPAAKDTTIVDADAMTLIGQQYFRGRGHVNVKRGKLTTSSGFAEFAQDSNYMHLNDKAIVLSDTFRLSADTIDADMVNGDQLKSVRARKDAQLSSHQANIDAPRLTISLDSGMVERTIAVGGERVGPGRAQAKTSSKDFDLTADSIDAVSPRQKLQHVTAVGSALGKRMADSLDAKLPELIARDWVKGDTVQAFFGATKPDTAVVLQRLVASGVPASSTYKFREKLENDSTQISVNYLTAKQIDVSFKDGKVDQVRAEGDIRGMYLQPPKQEKKAARK